MALSTFESRTVTVLTILLFLAGIAMLGVHSYLCNDSYKIVSVENLETALQTAENDLTAAQIEGWIGGD